MNLFLDIIYKGASAGRLCRSSREAWVRHSTPFPYPPPFCWPRRSCSMTLERGRPNSRTYI